MKKVFILLFIFMLSSWCECLATQNVLYISGDENVSVDISEGYTNDLIYNENYDYNLG